MLDRITPLILTYNEATNIGRSLEQLSWANDIVVVDSFSEDETLRIISAFPQVRVFQREFDKHSNQWNFGLEQTQIRTEWVLALDADYIVTAEFINELGRLDSSTAVNGYRANFTYCIQGKRLNSGIYPPVTVLFRKSRARYVQDGHTQRVFVEGGLAQLQAKILHDDRKPMRHWLQAQSRYTELEALKLLRTPSNDLSWTDRVRRWRVVAPVAVFFYCLVLRGGVLDGWAGFYYAFQRMLAELMVSLYLIERDLGISRHKLPAAAHDKRVNEPLEAIEDPTHGNV
ncbi:MAG TPA: glycosyltransferase family 2 protein [Pyrinomonadaceae bacterium]|nr:glycosyltransferase family 2 protein [Pyrinomonadaceae bacterium]